MLKGNHELLIYILKEFTPIEPFYTNYLLESKKFTTTELSNRAAPVYFATSFFMILSALFVINAFGYAGSLFLVCLGQLFSLFILLFMKDRDFIKVDIFYGLNGAISSFDLILRNLIIGELSAKNSIDVSMASNKVYRASTNSLACWIGQEIYYKIHTHEVNIIISIVTISCCISASLISILTGNCLNSQPESNIFDNTPDKFESQDFQYFLTLFSSIFSGCIYVFTSLYCHNIFNEKQCFSDSKPFSLNNSLFIKFLKVPIRAISFCIIWIVNLFTDKFKKIRQNSHLTVASGNIEGISGIFCPIMVYLITKNVKMEYKEVCYSFLLTLAGLSVYMLSVSRVSMFLYLLHILTIIAASSSDCIAKGILQTTKRRAFLLMIGSLNESIIHILINFVCKKCKFGVTGKGKIYGSIGLTFGTIMMVFKYHNFIKQKV